jgi:hypothetical protein
MANRGFGGAPAGFAADEQRKALADQTNQEGAAFTDYASKSYDDALKNFWNATSQLSGQGDAALSAAISANSAAANNYSNLYGTASTPKPSVLGGLLGPELELPGKSCWSGASMLCPFIEAKITLIDGTKKPAKNSIKAKHCSELTASRAQSSNRRAS